MQIDPIPLRRPYNADYCAAVECPNLRRGWCIVAECSRNHKWILYWETTGNLAPGDVPDA